MKRDYYVLIASVAQWLEHSPCKRGVEGSNPSRGLQARKQRTCHLSLISFGSMTLLLLHELKGEGDYMADEKYINFIANYDDWVAIKKLKVEPATQPTTIREF